MKLTLKQWNTITSLLEDRIDDLTDIAKAVEESHRIGDWVWDSPKNKERYDNYCNDRLNLQQILDVLNEQEV